MREAKDSGDVVGARLRAVLPGGSAPAVDHGPLNWSDIVPGWAEEELGPFAVAAAGGGPVAGGDSAGSSEPPTGGCPDRPSSGGAQAGRPPSARPPSARSSGGRSPVGDEAGGGFPAGSAWATGPPGREVEPPGFPWDETFYDRAVALAYRPVGPAGGAAAGIPPPDVASAADPSFAARPDPPSGAAGAEPVPARPELGGAGAFGGDPRAWLHAFDPGRPGVRALGAIAVVVVLVAGFLAWRARPRVEAVEPSAGGPGTTSVVSAPGPVGSAVGEVVVAVGGKVRRPGLVRLAPGARVADALTAAGGAEPGVDVAALNLARRVTDGELIMVGGPPPPAAGAAPGAAPSGAAGSLVNLNTATLGDLDGLPGVGPVLAQRILDARAAQGGFRAVGDLRKVDGIGDARYEQLKDLVTV